MELHRFHVDNGPKDWLQDTRNVVFVLDKHGVGGTLKTGPSIRTEILEQRVYQQNCPSIMLIKVADNK